MKHTISCLLAASTWVFCLPGPSAAAQGTHTKTSKTCTDDRGRPAKADATWCRAAELHVCNGKNGQWVNTRQKCKS